MNTLIERIDARLSVIKGYAYDADNLPKKIADEMLLLQDIRSELQARAKLEPQWIACSERMPEPHQKVVILLRGGLIFSGAYKAYYEKLPHEEGGPTYRYALTAEDFSSHTPVSSCATHWMPAESLRALLPHSPDTARME